MYIIESVDSISKDERGLPLTHSYIYTMQELGNEAKINNDSYNYVLGFYRTSFQHNLHCFINACVHVVNDYIVSNKPV